MNKRNIVRLISFLSAAVVVLSGFMVVEKQKSKRLMLQIENNYSKSLNEFSSSVNNISALLQKARFTNSPTTLSRYAAELLTEAEFNITNYLNITKQEKDRLPWKPFIRLTVVDEKGKRAYTRAYFLEEFIEL
jgi:hypothetical protein